MLGYPGFTGRTISLVVITMVVAAGIIACTNPAADETTITETEGVENTYEWQEFVTFRSEELSHPVRAPADKFYNQKRFSDRPLMQDVNFTIDKDWRFVITAEGEAETTFELYITVTASGEPGLSYSTEHIFTLHSAPLTIIREEPLEVRYTPPVDIEVKVFFDKPMDWIMTIEK